MSDAPTTVGDGGLERIYDAVEAILPGVLHPVVQMTLWDAIEDFCARSTLWRATVGWDLPAGDSTLNLSPLDADTRVRWVLDVRGLVRWRVEPPARLVDLMNGAQDRTGTALVACAPRKLGGALPSFLLDDWSEALRDGALSRLYMQPAKPYTNMQLAQFHGRRFKAGITQAKVSALHAGAPLWRFPYFAVQRSGRLMSDPAGTGTAPSPPAVQPTVPRLTISAGVISDVLPVLAVSAGVVSDAPAVVVPPPNPTPNPTPMTLLRLSTAGNQIVDSAGAAVRLKSVNWFGAESSNFVPHGLWARNYKDMLDQVKGWGFNCLRIPFSDDILSSSNVPNGIDTSKNADLVGLTALQVLDKIVDYGATIGLRFVLDHHRITSAGGAGTDGWPAAGFSSTYTQDQWATTWKAMATHYGSKPAVCGFDPHNEPHNIDWYSWAAGVELLANQVHAIAPDWLCFVEGVGDYSGVPYWWGGQLAGIVPRPVVLTVPNKVVYSPHEYGLSVSAQPWLKSGTNTVAGWPTSLKAVWEAAWSMRFKDNSAPIWIGEFGGKFGYNGNGAADSAQSSSADEKKWLTTLVEYLNGDLALNGSNSLAPGQKGMSFAYWSLNCNSGDTGGLLCDDWTTPQAGKLALLAPLLAA